MASLNVFFPTTPTISTQRRSLPSSSFKTYATAAKSSAGGSSSSEEKSFLDFILGGLTKEDQFYETDPILKKVEDGSNNGTAATSKNTKATVSGNKKIQGGGGSGNDGGGFGLIGGLFSKK